MNLYDYLRLVGQPFTSTPSYADAADSYMDTLNDHDALLGYLCCGTHRGSAEVPVMLAGALYDFVIHEGQTGSYCIPEGVFSQIAMPLCKSNEFVRKSPDSILKDFFSRTSVATRMSKVTTSKGDIFYGGPGVILSRELECLVLYSLHVTEVSRNSFGRMSVNFDEAIVRVSPKVFTSNDILSRNIIKKAIPKLCSTGGFSMDKGWLVPRNSSGERTNWVVPKVVVENIPQTLYRRPAVPEDPRTFDSSMRKFLRRDDIVEDIVRGL